MVPSSDTLYRMTQRPGFSLIELMVVVVVIGILGTLTIVQFSGGNQIGQVRSAQRLVRSDLEQVQLWAQVGKLCCGSVVPEGYGVVFQKNTDTYSVYAELGGNFQYDAATADTVLSTIDLSTSELLVKEALGSSGSSESIVLQDCAPLSGTTCDVYFHYPSGQVYTNGAQTTDFTLTLSHTARALTESVSVDITSGKIE